MVHVEWLVRVCTQVAANQLLLGPITLSTVFAYNLALLGKAHAIPDKIRNDLYPTIQNGAHGAGGTSPADPDMFWSELPLQWAHQSASTGQSLGLRYLSGREAASGCGPAWQRGCSGLHRCD
jgi:hypothetical protein